MLMGDEGHVRPASKESRLVMVKLEPSAEEFRRLNHTKKQGQEHEKKTTKRHCKETFSSLRKHVAIGKGFMAAHAHDIRLKVRPKWSDIMRKEQATVLTFEPVRSKIM